MRTKVSLCIVVVTMSVFIMSYLSADQFKLVGWLVSVALIVFFLYEVLTAPEYPSYYGLSDRERKCWGFEKLK